MLERGVAGTPNEASPSTSSSRPASTRSKKSQLGSRRDTDESTPLLANGDGEDRAYDGGADHDPLTESTSLLHPSDGRPGSRRRVPWPSIIALLLLCAFTIAIMLLGFFVPEIMEEYTLQAKELDIQSISLPEFTATGARARIQGVFWMNAANVKRKSVRDLGIFGTWMAKKVKSSESTVTVSLPGYDDLVLGTANVPSIELDIESGHRNDLDFLVDLEPGDVEGIRAVANDWLDGRLDKLTLRGSADVKLRSGILSLGTQTIAQTVVLQGDKIPAMPKYNISRLNVHEVNLTDGGRGMAADVSVTVQNNFPLDLSVPPLGFGILVDNCLPTDPRIRVASASIKDLRIRPQQDVQVHVSGLVRSLPDSLTSDCPGTLRSPLDTLLQGYMHGEKTTVYVTGSDAPSSGTPKWITDLISSVTVPVPVPGRGFGSLVRNFSLSDVHFSLPDPVAEPDSPESNPQISAKINVLVAMPEEMNFDLDINKVRANAKVFYHGDELGILNLKKWQQANATRIEPHGKIQQPTLLIQSDIKNAPIQITNNTVFTEVVQALLFDGKPIFLSINANVDAKIETALGKVTIRQVPGEGVVPIKPISSGNGSVGTPGFQFPKLNQSVGDIMIVNTSNTSLTLQAKVNFTNPTKYGATIPYVDINVLCNDTILGHVTARNITVVPGNNTNLTLEAVWAPAAHDPHGGFVGPELLSQYLSGYNTTLTFQTHEGTIPFYPGLGRALSALKLVVPTPRLRSPRDPDSPDDPDAPDTPDGDNRPRFIREAVLHVWSATADFMLASPIKATTIYLNYVNATAYHEDHVVGHIFYGAEFNGGDYVEFPVPPGLSQTPRLHVDFKLGSVGYEAIRKALGGSLGLRAESIIGVRIGDYQIRVWYVGRRVHAKVRM